MNRSRPRRVAATRRGLSREASPTREVDDDAQEPPKEEPNTGAALPPRLSTRNKRGTPTPPPVRNDPPAADETDTADGGNTQAQHTTEEDDVVMAVNKEEYDCNDKQEAWHEDSKESERVEQADYEPRNPQSVTANIEARQKNAPPEQASPAPEGSTDGNGESPHREIPTVTPEDSMIKGDDTGFQDRESPAPSENVPTLNDTKPKTDASSCTTNGLGDDHAVDEDDDNGNNVCSKALAGKPTANENTMPGVQATEYVPSTSLHKRVNVGTSTGDEASIPATVENKETSAGDTAEATLVSSVPGAADVCEIQSSRAESRIVSLGSKSVPETVRNRGNGNDHEELVKISNSPQMSLDSLNENQDKPNDFSEKDSASKDEDPLSTSKALDRVVHVATSNDRKIGVVQDKETRIKGTFLASDGKRPAGSDVSQIAAEAPQGENDSASNLLNAHSALHSEEQKMALASMNGAPSNVNKPRVFVSSSQEYRANTVASEDVADANDRRTIFTTDGRDTRDDSNNAAHVPVMAHMPRLSRSDQNKLRSSDSSFPGMSRLPTPQPRRNVSNSVVVSSAFTIDIRQIAKDSSSAHYSLGGLANKAHGRTEMVARKNAVESDAVDQQRDNNVQVKDDISLVEPRKHRLTDNGNDRGGSSSREGRPELKRQRKDSIPVGVPSSTLQNSSQHQSAKIGSSERSEATSTRASRLFHSDVTGVERVKIRLYDIASKVHRGKGSERRFAAYWEALSRFLGCQAQQGVSSGSHSCLEGVHEILDSFLVTKQMRKLHNLLVMGKF